AMGIDAWLLASRMAQSGLESGMTLPGTTGRLAVGPDGRGRRYLGWGRFARGRGGRVSPAPDHGGGRGAAAVALPSARGAALPRPSSCRLSPTPQSNMPRSPAPLTPSNPKPGAPARLLAPFMTMKAVMTIRRQQQRERRMRRAQRITGRCMVIDRLHCTSVVRHA